MTLVLPASARYRGNDTLIVFLSGLQDERENNLQLRKRVTLTQLVIACNGDMYNSSGGRNTQIQCST